MRASGQSDIDDQLLDAPAKMRRRIRHSRSAAWFWQLTGDPLANYSE